MAQVLNFLRKIFAPIFITALIIWLVFYTNFRFSQVYDYFFTVSWWYLLICVFLFYIHILLVCYAWFYLLRSLGVDLPFWQAAIVLGVSNIAKYLPGGIWQIGSRAVGLTNYQGEPTKVVLSIVIEQIISLSGCFVLAILFLPRDTSSPWPNFFSDIPHFILLGSAVVLFVCSSLPCTYRILLKFIPRLNCEFHLGKLGFSSLMKINLIHYFSLILFSLGYWACIKAYIPSFSINFYDFTALTMIATFSGFIAIFTPAGLGVREAVLFVGIQAEVGQSAALTLALIPRLLIIMSEVIFLLSKMIVRWYFVHNNDEKSL